MRAFIAGLFALLILFALPSAAQNPFTGGPAPQAAPAQAQPDSGWFNRINRELSRYQREATREMASRLRAIRDGETPLALLVGVGLAFLYGVIHAAGPGHGKAVVIGYFLAQHAKPWRGALMGLQIAVGHVVSAIVIALGADLIFRTVWGTSAADLRSIQLSSYALIVLIGFYMLVQTARGVSHAHAHDHGHGHADGHGHSHDHDEIKARRHQRLLSLGVGLVPCTGAILVMLFALANGILLAGFVLVAAIAAGMAVTMAGLGLLAIGARHLVAGWLARPDDGGNPHGLMRAAQYLGGATILAIGLLLLWGAY